MKAITLHQPWATLIALGVKTIETRSWPFPGAPDFGAADGVPLAIHAAKSIPRYAYDAMASEPALVQALYDRWPRVRLDELPLGKVIAVCEVVACLPSEREPGVPWTSPVFEKNAPYGDFSPGRWLWLLDKIQPLVFPMPAVGHQGLWDWTPPGEVDAVPGAAVAG